VTGHEVLEALARAQYEWAKRFEPWTLTPWLDDSDDDDECG